MIPKEEIYIPPMNVKVLDHRHFGRKPIVGVHVIKSLSKFRINRERESFLFSNIEAIQNAAEQTNLTLDDESDSGSPVNRSVKHKVRQFFRRENKERRDSKFKRVNKAFGTLSAELV